jgi:hypothetical protein
MSSTITATTSVTPSKLHRYHYCNVLHHHFYHV